MEFWEEALNEMTVEVREQVKAELEKRFPHVEFRSYYDNASDGLHVIALNDSKLDESKEFLRFLGELEKKYQPDYDIMDIGYIYRSDFKQLDKRLNKNIVNNVL